MPRSDGDSTSDDDDDDEAEAQAVSPQLPVVGSAGGPSATESELRRLRALVDEQAKQVAALTVSRRVRSLTSCTSLLSAARCLRAGEAAAIA